MFTFQNYYLKTTHCGLKIIVSSVVSLSSVYHMIFYRVMHMHSVDCAVERCLSICLSVRLSHTGIEFKRLYISSKFFHHWVAPPF